MYSYTRVASRRSPHRNRFILGHHGSKNVARPWRTQGVEKRHTRIFSQTHNNTLIQIYFMLSRHESLSQNSVCVEEYWIRENIINRNNTCAARIRKYRWRKTFNARDPDRYVRRFFHTVWRLEGDLGIKICNSFTRGNDGKNNLFTKSIEHNVTRDINSFELLNNTVEGTGCVF